MGSTAGTLSLNSAVVSERAQPAGASDGQQLVQTASKLKPAARRRMATVVTHLMPWDVRNREYYPPQAAAIDLAVRIALAVVDEGRDVEDVTAGETAELARALAPVVQEGRGNAEYLLDGGPWTYLEDGELEEARAFLDSVTSGRYEAELLDGTRWAISRAAQMFAGANAPTTALQARKLAESLIERRDRSAQKKPRERTAADSTARATEASEGSAQTRVCAQ